jgi:hypothetical protein
MDALVALGPSEIKSASGPFWLCPHKHPGMKAGFERRGYLASSCGLFIADGRKSRPTLILNIWKLCSISVELTSFKMIFSSDENSN